MTDGSAGTAAIELRSLAKSFGHGKDRLDVLDDVSMTVGAGEFVSILGPSGCGKSTIFHLLTGIESPDSGAVLIRGVEAGDGRSFAWMPQGDVLLPWRTVAGNVALGAEVAAGRSRSDAAAVAAGLLEEFGLAGFAGSRPFEISGGMRQRAGLARTVAQGRDVLLLDEPFGALDALTRTELQLWLERVWEHERWTVLLITHDVREAVVLSDRIYVLGRRPARIELEVEVTLPRPRGIETLASPEAVELEGRLLRSLNIGSGTKAEETD